MARSVNNWSVISSTQLNRNPFPGTKIVPKPGTRKGDVATILHYLGSRFNAKVEKLYNPGCWGYAYKRLGSNSWSNHASGTAIDLNAPTHPWKKKGTFTYKQRLALRSILNFFEGAVTWGGDWSIAYVDEMHFEIHGGGAKIKKIANKIKNPMVDKVETFKNDYATLYAKFPSPDLINNFRKKGKGKPNRYVMDNFLNKDFVKKAQYNKDIKVFKSEISRQARAIKNLDTKIGKLEGSKKTLKEVINARDAEVVLIAASLDKCQEKLSSKATVRDLNVLDIIVNYFRHLYRKAVSKWN